MARRRRTERAASPQGRRRLAVVNFRALSPTETFIRHQVNHLPFAITLIHREDPELCELPPPVLHLPRVRRAPQLTQRYLELFRCHRIEAVLAQYGPTAVEVLPACKALALPLVVHFHGHDISRHKLLQRHERDYLEVFAYASAIVCVSEPMRTKLLEIGADPERLHLIPYGVDVGWFAPRLETRVVGRIVSCGRFVAKKAPQLVLTAFGQVNWRFPESCLHMIGAGPLYEACRDLVYATGLRDRVRFRGLLDSAGIRDELQQASIFVNHSVTGPDGDTEGTPVSVLEASAAGLPVVASRHAGIPDVIAHGRTGLLVAERDVAGLADSLCRLLEEPRLAAAFGACGRATVQQRFEATAQLRRLSEVIRTALQA